MQHQHWLGVLGTRLGEVNPKTPCINPAMRHAGNLGHTILEWLAH
jgi:hypothetical protein